MNIVTQVDYNCIAAPHAAALFSANNVLIMPGGEPPYTKSPRYDNQPPQQCRFSELTELLKSKLSSYLPTTDDSSEVYAIIDQLSSLFADKKVGNQTLLQQVSILQKNNVATEKRLKKSLKKVERELQAMLVNEGNLMNSFTGYNGTKLVHPPKSQASIQSQSLYYGRPSNNQFSTGKLHQTALSRETDQNITPRNVGIAFNAVFVHDNSTPRSNINNTNTVSPYESLHMLRAGAQTTRLSSEGHHYNQHLTLIQIRAQKTLKKVRKLLKSQLKHENFTDELVVSRAAIHQPLTLSMSSINSKQKDHINNGAEKKSKGGSNRITKRSPILCIDQTGFQTSRETYDRRILNNFVAPDHRPIVKQSRSELGHKRSDERTLNQVCSPEMNQNLYQRLEDQFSATFNNQISSVQKHSDAIRASPSNIVPEFYTDESSFKDQPRVPKLNLDKLLEVNNTLKSKGSYQIIRRASTSGDEINETSFGEDSKSQHQLGRRVTNGIQSESWLGLKNHQDFSQHAVQKINDINMDKQNRKSKRNSRVRGQFMSFIDSQQFSPIQSVQSEHSQMILVADEVQMLKTSQSNEKFNKNNGLHSLKKLIDCQRKVQKFRNTTFFKSIQNPKQVPNPKEQTHDQPVKVQEVLQEEDVPPPKVLTRQFTENILALPRQMKQRLIREKTENRDSKKSLLEKSMFPEALITLNQQILQKHLPRMNDGPTSTRSLTSQLSRANINTMMTNRSCSKEGEPVKATAKIRGLNFRRRNNPDNPEFQTCPAPKTLPQSTKGSNTKVQSGSSPPSTQKKGSQMQGGKAIKHQNTTVRLKVLKKQIDFHLAQSHR